MPEASLGQRLQVYAEKTLVVSSHLFGIAAGFGFIKRLQNPWIRGASLTAVAATQALSERDRQIQVRKSLVCKKDRITRLSFSDYSNEDVNTVVMDEDEAREFLQCRLDSFYNPNAIAFKSAVVGASFGVLPLIFEIQVPSFLGNFSLNRLYAWSTGVSPMFNDFGYEFMEHVTFKCYEEEQTKELDFLEIWRATPRCWYGRKGKEPIFPFWVQEDKK